MSCDDIKRDVLAKVKELTRMPKDAEYAVVIFEDGYATPVITQKMFHGAVIPFMLPGHGVARAVIHTHPVPRFAPSIADLKVLLAMAEYRTPAYLATVYSEGEEAVATIYTAKERVPGLEAAKVLEGFLKYEDANILLDFKESLSHKQAWEQHAVLERLGITVEKYRFKVAS